MAGWRNRVIGLEYHKPADIADHRMQWRVHPAAQKAALKGILKEVGIAGALLAYRDGDGLVALDGHLRKSLDPDVAWPVLVLDVDEAEARKLLVSYDPIGALAVADAEALEALLREVETGDAALRELLDGLAADAGIALGPEPPEDPGPRLDEAGALAEKWGVKLGQVWELGEHRLVCGDCTDPAVVEAVMRGEKAGVVVTDPPYGWGFYEQDKVIGWADWQTLFDSLIHNAIATIFGYFWTLAPLWLDCKMDGWERVEYIVWAPPNQDIASPNHLLRRNQGILVMKRGWAKWRADAVRRGEYSRPEFLGMRSKTGKARFPDWEPHPEGARWPDVWDDSAPGTMFNRQLRRHPNEKPISVFERLIALSSNSGEIIMDWFVGSGTTIIACERLGRKARACEISPAYIGVALQRFLDATGLKPRLVESGNS